MAARAGRRCAGFAVALAACGSVGGGGPLPSEAPVDGSAARRLAFRRRGTRTPPVDFVFESLDDRPRRSEATRGSPPVLAFVTTSSLSSQAQVDFLVAMARHDEAASCGRPAIA